MSVNNLSSYNTNFEGVREYVVLEKEVYSRLANPTKLEAIEDTFEAFKPKDSRDAAKLAATVLSPIPTVRKLSAVPQNFKDGNILKALGMLAFATVFVPEDARDVRDAALQILKKKKPSYDHKQYQHEFSFFRGTLMEPLLKFKKGYAKKFSNKLYSADRSLLDCKIGTLAEKLFRFDVEKTSLDRKDIMGNTINAFKVNGNKMADIVGRSLARANKLTAGFFALLEVPAVIKSVDLKSSFKDNVKEVSKQISKSLVNVTSFVSGIALTGAVMAKKFGAAGSLLGMALGALVGGTVSSAYANLLEGEKST